MANYKDNTAFANVQRTLNANRKEVKLREWKNLSLAEQIALLEKREAAKAKAKLAQAKVVADEPIRFSGRYNPVTKEFMK